MDHDQPQKPISPTLTAGGIAWSKVRVLLLAAISVGIIALCLRILSPFIVVFTWSLAIAVVTYPLFNWSRRIIPSKGIAALLTTILVGLLIVGPLTFVFQMLLTEVSSNAQYLQQALSGDGLSKFLSETLGFRGLGRSLAQNFDRQSINDGISKVLSSVTPVVFTTSVWSVMQLLLTLFTLFYLFRDKGAVLTEIGNLLPLKNSELQRLFQLVKETLFATLYGTVVVAVIQGVLGGVMFALLGLPAPFLWGFVMAILALIPNMGAFVIWVPAAIYFFATGDPVKGAILSLWGALVVGLVDNMLYPMLVGKELRLHPLPVFFFILGGVSVFGAAGIVLGPLTLSLADGLFQVWRERFQDAGE